jgi:N-acylglucosamine 2-epimerase
MEGEDMEKERLNKLPELYRRQLLNDVIPFWMRYSLDKEYGGYFTCLDRDGSVYNTDKYAWLQGRQVWIFSKLYNELEPRPEWLELATSGVKFIIEHGFDPKGQMYFSLTRDGRPLCKPWNIFTETFGIIGLAEYAKATGDEDILKRAQRLYWDVVGRIERGELSTYTVPETRKIESLAIPMILLTTTQDLDQVAPDPRFAEIIDDCLERILHRHACDEKKALFENVSPEGSRLDSPQGRCILPGHAIESAWFILREGKRRNNRKIIDRALQILDWSLQWGWDPEYGGLLYFVDSEGKPPEQLEWDMKLWWPHTEALYALLLAYHLSGKKTYWDWYEKMHEWTFSHFPDSQYGEWFGYLHRDGTPALYLKGSMWKGCFHLPRSLLLGLKILEKMQAE